MDLTQFAHRPLRGVKDATVTLLNKLLGYLDGNGTHARLIFVDISPHFSLMALKISSVSVTMGYCWPVSLTFQLDGSQEKHVWI